ncbi:hypothetical protein J2X66_005060 [Pseudomonas sp. 3296]|nr:hypothetical protein [Pseudomonas sp. 3296]
MSCNTSTGASVSISSNGMAEKSYAKAAWIIDMSAIVM